MNPDRAADLAALADTPLPDGRDVLVRAVDDDVQILGHVPNGATVHLDNREMQGGWLDLPDETAEAVVGALTRVATDPQFAAQGAELSMRQAQDIAATLHVDGISSPAAPGALVLSDSERKVLVAGLISQAEMRDPELSEPGFFDEREIYADLASDPTYFGDERATDAYVERERRSYNAFAESAAALGRPFTDLAEQVERTGRLDLTDRSTWDLVNDTVDDFGASKYPEAQSEWRRIVEAVDAHCPQDRAAPGPLLVLSDSERKVLVAGLISAAELRDAESDAGLGRPFTDLAEQVERTGRLDLTDRSTWDVVNDTVEDCVSMTSESEWGRIVQAVNAHIPQDRAGAAGTWDAASRASTIALQTGNTVDDSIAEAAFTDARVAASSLGPQGTAGVSRGFGAAPGASSEGRSDVARQLGRVNVDRLREVVRIRTEVEPPAPRRSDRYDASERPTPQRGMER